MGMGVLMYDRSGINNGLRERKRVREKALSDHLCGEHPVKPNLSRRRPVTRTGRKYSEEVKL